MRIRVGASDPTELIAEMTCARVVPAPIVELLSFMIPEANVVAVSDEESFRN